jgi:hypothetical protein
VAAVQSTVQRLWAEKPNSSALFSSTPQAKATVEPIMRAITSKGYSSNLWGLRHKDINASLSSYPRKCLNYQQLCCLMNIAQSPISIAILISMIL